jgi:hypothetical protein
LARKVKALPIEVNSGQRLASAKSGAFLEYFRLDGRQQPRDTRYALVSRRNAVMRADARPSIDDRVHAQAIPPPRLGVPERRPRTLRELFGL